jgi:ABC-2 type transport system ATP-binding protein
VLHAENLTRRFGERTIGPLDLSLEPGDRVALLGPNGAGKSTLLRCLAGTLRATGGTATVGGHDAGTRAARALVGVSLAAERSYALRLTGYENLLVAGRMRGAPRAEATRQVDALVEELELEAIAGRRVDECSAGMVQQVSLARALIGEPPLLLLDEPTRSLDEAAHSRLWGCLDRRERTAVLVASHDRADAARCHGVVELGG